MPRRLRSCSARNQKLTIEVAEAEQAALVHGRRRASPLVIALGRGLGTCGAADGVGSNWIKSFGIADDHEDADGIDILDFWQACDKAKQLARGKGTDSGKTCDRSGST